LKHDRIVLACNPHFVVRRLRDHSHESAVRRYRIDADDFRPVHADPPKVAVFDFELVDTSLQGEVNGPRTDEQGRLMRVGDQLRKELTESGKFHLLDISPVNAAAHGSNLQACGGCDVQYAQRLGADLVITGVVQKVSNVILNINIYLRDVHSGRLVTLASADMRGNTDESCRAR